MLRLIVKQEFFPPHSIWFYIIFILNGVICYGAYVTGADLLNEIKNSKKESK